MGKLRQNSEVTCPRSCNLSVAKPGTHFQKSRSQTSVQSKSLPTTTKQAIYATFFSSYCCHSPGDTEEVNDFSWLNSCFLWQKAPGSVKVLYYALCRGVSSEAQYKNKNMVSPWQGDCTGPNKVVSYFLQKTCCLAFFTRCSSFRFFCRACLLDMSSTCSAGNQPLSRSESFTPSIHPSVWGKAQHQEK